MSRARVAAPFLALCLLLTAVLPAAANEDPAPPASPPSAEIIPGRVGVQWRDQQRGADVAAAHGLAIASEMSGKELALPTVVATNGRPVDQVLSELRADPAVEYAEPDYRVALAEDGSVAVAVNDPKTAGQYSLDQMRVRDAWSLSTGGSGIVAVLDTGVQMNHPDLTGRLLPGYDFVNDDEDASDDNGHGTWVSGIIAANANDGYGIAGISWSDKILPVKIMDGAGTGSTSDLSSGIIWAANHGATVINMSVGGFPYAQYVQDAVDYAWSKGAVLIGAAGNNGRQEDYYPASFAHVVSVSATQVDDEFAHWSSYGAKVDVSAPGASVQTTNCYTCTYGGHDTWGSHTYISGTSFATPNVAGVVALIRARYPSWTAQQVVERLFSTVDDRGYAGYDIRYGRGRVNALRALGGSPSALGLVGGDGLEGNNTLGTARLIALNTTTRPSIYPAGDVDVMAVDVPRAGRLEVRVTGVVDARDYPWNRSTLPVDPIVELYTVGGTLLKRVDSQWESGTEVATADVSGATRLLVRVSNYYANGNRSAYSINPTFVDTVPPTATINAPLAGTIEVSRFVSASVTFSEPVTGVSASSFRLRDLTTNALVPSTVTYDPSTRTAKLDPGARLEALRRYQVEVSSGVFDAGGNAVTPARAAFTTGLAAFDDLQSSAFVTEINWLVGESITSGCSETRFCPTAAVSREQMASFLTRSLDLPAAAIDYFADDQDSLHQGDINAVAAASVSHGCATSRFCPSGSVTRGQMASFLARSLGLPLATSDYFVDDAGSIYEADINRVAAAGITMGCSASNFCPSVTVTREQMAAFLYRAFSGG